MKPILECVPNFSEGRDSVILEAIASAVRSVEGVTLLDVDPGKATNRTVFTFVGEAEPLVEAAFRAMEVASKRIDMRKHQGEHPRMGATDVCPFIPLSGATMEDAVDCARALGKRVGDELGIPVYLYEQAASRPERRNLATVRAGEYEGMEKKMQNPDWKPDFGPSEFNPLTGCTAIGARNFLVAYNVNLNTTSVRRANSVAFDVRERGRVKREGNPITGKVETDVNGEPVYLPGKLKSVKAIGWYIEEYGIAQISMNLTDISITSVHEAFDAVCESATDRGMRVTGSELVGLIPLQAMLDAGRHYLRKQGRSEGVSEGELIKIAVRSLGLDDLKPFDADKKIIEYRMRNAGDNPLAGMTLRAFADETASESPAPGGGSISAYMGSLAAALATMVANLSSHKRGWDDKIQFFSDWAVKGQQLKDKLLYLVDEDTKAFNRIMDAFRLPQDTESDKETRRAAIQYANIYAMEVPFEVMKACSEVRPLAAEMAKSGMSSSLSDTGVALHAALAGMEGAFLNVQINGSSMKDSQEALELMKKASDLAGEMRKLTALDLAALNEKMSSF
jgi:glutamate formiminotransferase / formiminotetrahydrofolate cyclodeaminase